MVIYKCVRGYRFCLFLWVFYWILEMFLQCGILFIIFHFITHIYLFYRAGVQDHKFHSGKQLHHQWLVPGLNGLHLLPALFLVEVQYQYCYVTTEMFCGKIVLLMLLHCLKSLWGPSWSWSYGSWIYNYLCYQYLSPLKLWEPSWSWSYGSWIYNYLCYQYLSTLKLWVWIPLMVKCTRYNITW